jgi:hypothetical protein
MNFNISLFLFITIILNSNRIEAQPSNDNCADAFFIPVGTSCEFDTVYSSVGATGEPTSVAPNPSCGFYQGADVWFKTVMPASGALRVQRNNLSLNAQFAIYSGSCGAMTQLFCNQLNAVRTVFNPALAGQDIYIRVYNYNSPNGGTFELCIWEPEVPSNNFCENAITLNVGDTCVMQQFTNAYATASPAGTAPAPSCGFYQGGDVWFVATMPSSGELRVERTNISTNAQVAIYSGSCGDMVQVDCMQLDGDRTILRPNLSDSTIYIRVYNYNNADGGTFTICLFEPKIPANNFCANAIPLTVRNTCIYELFTARYATASPSGTAPNPSCGFYSGGDVWFTLLMPNTGTLQITRQNFSGMNAQFALYTGVCGEMTQISCAQLNANMTVNNIDLAGQTLYLRVYNYNSQEGGEFNICAFNPTCAGIEEQFDSVAVCYGSNYTFADGNTVNNISEFFIYTSTFQLENLCDSLIITNVEVISEEISVIENDGVFEVTNEYFSYQWLDCDNDFAEISGANSSSFAPEADGNYAVMVTAEDNNVCPDTSACYIFSTVGLPALRSQNVFSVFPNPVKDVLTIQSKTKDEFLLNILDITGKVVSSSTIFIQQQEISVEHLKDGIYIIQLFNGERQQLHHQKFVKLRLTN